MRFCDHAGAAAWSDKGVSFRKYQMWPDEAYKPARQLWVYLWDTCGLSSRKIESICRRAARPRPQISEWLRRNRGDDDDDATGRLDALSHAVPCLANRRKLAATLEDVACRYPRAVAWLRANLRSPRARARLPVGLAWLYLHVEAFDATGEHRVSTHDIALICAQAARPRAVIEEAVYLWRPYSRAWWSDLL